MVWNGNVHRFEPVRSKYSIMYFKRMKCIRPPNKHPPFGLNWRRGQRSQGIMTLETPKLNMSTFPIALSASSSCIVWQPVQFKTDGYDRARFSNGRPQPYGPKRRGYRRLQLVPARTACLEVSQSGQKIRICRKREAIGKPRAGPDSRVSPSSAKL